MHAAPHPCVIHRRAATSSVADFLVCHPGEVVVLRLVPDYVHLAAFKAADGDQAMQVLHETLGEQMFDPACLSTTHPTPPPSASPPIPPRRGSLEMLAAPQHPTFSRASLPPPSPAQLSRHHPPPPASTTPTPAPRQTHTGSHTSRLRGGAASASGYCTVTVGPDPDPKPATSGAVDPEPKPHSGGAAAGTGGPGLWQMLERSGLYRNTGHSDSAAHGTGSMAGAGSWAASGESLRQGGLSSSSCSTSSDDLSEHEEDSLLGRGASRKGGGGPGTGQAGARAHSTPHTDARKQQHPHPHPHPQHQQRQHQHAPAPRRQSSAKQQQQQQQTWQSRQEKGIGSSGRGQELSRSSWTTPGGAGSLPAHLNSHGSSSSSSSSSSPSFPTYGQMVDLNKRAAVFAEFPTSACSPSASLSRAWLRRGSYSIWANDPTVDGTLDGVVSQIAASQANGSIYARYSFAALAVTPDAASEQAPDMEKLLPVLLAEDLGGVSAVTLNYPTPAAVRAIVECNFRPQGP
ncbi:MAG: hypothetical protein WDW36_004537 [Sanguina aurantia]